MSGFDYRLVAYEPWSAKLGVLPEPLRFTFTLSEFGWATCDVYYADNAVRSEMLEDGPELALEWGNDNGWDEPDFARMLWVETTDDKLDGTGVVHYKFHGLGWLLDSKMFVWDESPQDPADGPVRPVRTFTDPNAGQLLQPLWNAEAARIWGVAGVDYAEPPDKLFTAAADAADVPWNVTLDGDIDFGVTEPLGRVQRLVVDAAMAEPVWTKRRYRLYNYGTYGRDLFSGPDPVTLLPALGMTGSPDSRNVADMCSRVKVWGEDGQSLTREDLDADVRYGRFGSAIAAPGVHDLAAMNRVATAESRRGSRPQEQYTREWTSAGGIGALPGRDYWIRDDIRFKRWRKNDNDRTVHGPVTEISITRDAKTGITGHTKIKDRKEDRQATYLRRIYQLSLGTSGTGGLPADPQGDDRAPSAPTNVQVVTTTYPDAKGVTKGHQVVTWEHDGLSIDGDALNLRGFEIGEKYIGGAISLIGDAGENAVDWRREDIPVRERNLYVRAVSHRGFVSAWSDDDDGNATVVQDDDEALTGADLIVDSPHRHSGIRANRAEAAGAGFAYELVSGAYSAAFTSTTPIHDYGVAGGATAGQKAKSGRVACEAGDSIVGNFKARLGAGSSGEGRLRARFFDDSGATLATNTLATSGPLTGSTSSHVGTTIAPAGASSFTTWTDAPAVGAGAKVFINNVSVDRRTVENRMDDDSVSTRILQQLSVITNRIAERAVTGLRIALRTIEAENVVVNSLTANEIAARTITAAEIAVGTLTATEIATGTITATELAADSVTASELQADAVNGMTISGVTIAALHVTSASATILAIEGLGFDMSQSCSIGGDLTVDGTINNPSTRASKKAIKPITLAQSLAFIEAAEPVTHQRPVDWHKEQRTTVVLDDEGRPTRKRSYRKADQRRYASLLADSLHAAGIDEPLAFGAGGELVGRDIGGELPYLIPALRDVLARLEAVEKAVTP